MEDPNSASRRLRCAASTSSEAVRPVQQLRRRSQASRPLWRRGARVPILVPSAVVRQHVRTIASERRQVVEASPPAAARRPERTEAVVRVAVLPYAAGGCARRVCGAVVEDIDKAPVDVRSEGGRRRRPHIAHGAMQSCPRPRLQADCRPTSEARPVRIALLPWRCPKADVVNVQRTATCAIRLLRRRRLRCQRLGPVNSLTFVLAQSDCPPLPRSHRRATELPLRRGRDARPAQRARAGFLIGARSCAAR